MRYWVVGGEYTSTDFATIVGDGREEFVGPYDIYADAYDEWQRRSWARVDNCHVRYRIVTDDTDWHPTGLAPAKANTGSEA